MPLSCGETCKMASRLHYDIANTLVLLIVNWGVALMEVNKIINYCILCTPFLQRSDFLIIYVKKIFQSQNYVIYITHQSFVFGILPVFFVCFDYW